ncbi:FAD/NAD(P)-binding domain-containing protein [Hypoxylon trugodes]|uniref:FAD/NAD(P)-binding domain-containing protein n=1 Tax=Hypoxylon trugodes TaxID=326681 RepID=UPI0021A12441|nr:FAD/NAD(P)-binding domain-containing protein [Hypoxylon trugodes]KAI1385656.1 FAD/NAD(P)-binding domain-containing protein [Hypoxylon trugodes]
MHVIIIGAGLGGLSLAQCLRKQGISFEIFERDVTPKARFQGWAIALYGSTVEDLASSFPSDVPDLRESTNHLQPLSIPAQLCMYAPDKDGRIGVEDSSEIPLIRAERLRLRNWLATNLSIQWGKRLTRIEQGDDGVSVYFEDGTSAKGDIVVGADGVKSVVREYLLEKPNSDLLSLVPLAAIVGQLELSGDAFKRQLELGHSGYLVRSQELGFFNFCGLHETNPDGVSGKHYWMWMTPDPNVAEPDHWLQNASQQEKLDHVLKSVAPLPPQFREIFEQTPASGITEKPYIWRDLQLEQSSLPAGRVVLLGDAAHAMTPFRGEGGFHAFIDALKLSKVLGQLNASEVGNGVEGIKTAIAEYNSEMLQRCWVAVQDSRNMQVGKQPGKAGAKPWRGARPLPKENIVLQPMA